MKNLSPIVLFVYNRPRHTQQTIEALQKNELASESNLIIYSDEAKTENEQENVDKVRLQIEQIDTFNKVTIIKREKNWSLANNIIDGVTKVVNQYEKIIVLEDDLVTSPYFLKYMNEALDFYKDEEEVMSITGFSYLQKIPKNYNKDVFIFYRTCSWGWAIWKNEWNVIDFNIRKNHEIFKNESLQNKFNRGGDDLFDMLKMQIEGKINSWAIRFALSHSLHNKYALFPSKSLVQNIGHDGTGVHSIPSNANDKILDYKFIPQINKVKLDNDCVLSLQKNLNYTIISKLKLNIKKLIPKLDHDWMEVSKIDIIKKGTSIKKHFNKAWLKNKSPWNFYEPTNLIIVEKNRKLLLPIVNKSNSILDVGCAGGDFLNFVLNSIEKKIHVIGVDIAEQAIKKAKLLNIYDELYVSNIDNIYDFEFCKLFL